MQSNSLAIYSIGVACQLLQITPPRLEKLAAQLELSPAMLINGVPHYTAADLETIAGYLSGKAEKHPTEKLTAKKRAKLAFEYDQLIGRLRGFLLAIPPGTAEWENLAPRCFEALDLLRDARPCVARGKPLPARHAAQIERLKSVREPAKRGS